MQRVFRAAQASAAITIADMPHKCLHPKEQRLLCRCCHQSRENLARSSKRPGLPRNRIAIRAAADGRETNRLDFIFDRKLQRIPITIPQNLGLMVLSSSPNRTNCVNDKTRRTLISASDFRFAWSTTSESPTFGEQLGPSGAMDCTVDPAAAQESGVRGVNDGIHVELRDIAADNVDFAVGIFHDRSPKKCELIDVIR